MTSPTRPFSGPGSSPRSVLATWTSRWRQARDLWRLGADYRPYIATQRGGLVVAVLLSILYAGLRTLEPWPLQLIFDQAILGKPSALPGVDLLAYVNGDRMLLLLIAAASILVLALLSGSVYYVQSVLLARIGQDLVRDLREDAFHQLIRLSLAYHRNRDTGDLLMRLTGDMIMLREMVVATLVTLTGEVILLLVTLALMVSISPELTLVTVVMAPTLYGLFRWFRLRMVSAARKQRRREGKLAKTIGDVLLAIPMIQTFTAEAMEDQRFRLICKRSQRAGLRAARLEAGMQRLVEVILAIGVALVVWLGAREILAGQMTPGVFLVFLAYMRALARPVRKLSKVAERTARASAAAERVLEILHAGRAIKDSKKAVPAGPLSGALEFDKVSFAYEDGTVALENVSFTVQPGETVAIVGPTGSGKTTLFSLLLRFGNPTSGRVRFDGQRAKSFTLQSLRRQIAYLPQEPFVVSGSLRENLLYGRPNASDDELLRAVEAAGFGDVVRSRPRGLDTYVAPRGQSLSGGERQRLAIARALLKDAPILLLDEPTTGLDAATEAKVLRSLATLRQGRTTLIIAHRLSTVRDADRVLVLRSGRLIENSHPSELLRKASFFREMAQMQGMARDVPLIDPELRGLGLLSSANGTETLLAEIHHTTHASGQSRPPQAPLGSGPLTLVKHRPGRRAVLHLSMGELGPSLYVKLHRKSRAARADFDRMTRLEAPAARVGVIIPHMVAYLDTLDATVTEDVKGRPLSLPAQFRVLGERLARLHDSLPTPQRVQDVSYEPTRLEKILTRVPAEQRELLPSLRSSLEAWTTRWQALCEAQTGEDLRPIHGDFYPAQVQWTDAESPAILDWDEYCLGDPERDVANFEAHLELEEQQGLRNDSVVLREAFRAGYESERSLRDEMFEAHRRATFLRLAILYANPSFGSQPPNPVILSQTLLRLSAQPAAGAAESTASSTVGVGVPR